MEIHFYESMAVLPYGCADIGEWDDDHPLNYRNSDISECEKYFKE